MIPHPKRSRPAELQDKVSCDDTGCHPDGAGGQGRVRENVPSLLEWKTVDQYHGDLGHVPLEESRQERATQLILHVLERRPYAQYDALNESLLLLDGLL